MPHAIPASFRTLDLNLLRVFDEVMAERSLTRAARNLSLAGKINWAPAPHLKLSAAARYNLADADTNDQDIAATSPVVLAWSTSTAGAGTAAKG